MEYDWKTVGIRWVEVEEWSELKNFKFVLPPDYEISTREADAIETIFEILKLMQCIDY